MKSIYEQRHPERLYLSQLHYKLQSVPKIVGVKKQITTSNRNNRTFRPKDHLYSVDCICQDESDQIKRKNAYLNKYKTAQRNSIQSNCTPYQKRKNKQKLLFKDKQQKIIVQLKKIPFQLQESKNKWLIVKQALSASKHPRLKSQKSIQPKIRQRMKSSTSSQPINIDLSDLVCQEQDNKQPLQNDKNKCTKGALNYYKNKNVIKQHLQTHPNHPQKKQQINLNLQLSAISSNLTDAKKSLRSYLYTSKFKMPKSRLRYQQSPTELKNHLITSTHSDRIEKICNATLNGVLNSFKVDMKQKQQIKARPKTAAKVFKAVSQLKKKKNGSYKVIDMTGWQDYSDKFQKDILFFS